MEEVEEIDLRDLFLIVWKKRKMIILTTIAFMLLGLAYSTLTTSSEEYETFTTLRINIMNEKVNDGDYDAQLNALAITDRLINTYGEIAKSKTVANEVIEKLNLKDASEKKMTYKQFTEKIEVALIGGTEMIKITVKGDDAKEVAAIANETSDSFLRNIGKIIKTENVKSVQVIDEAEVPEDAESGGKLLNIVIASVLGLMLSVFVAFLLNYLNNTVRKTEELERLISAPVLAEIKKGDEDLNVYEKLRTALMHGVLDDGDKSIAITSTVSNEGKTETAINLAKSISKLGKKTLILDCNFRNPSVNNILGLSNIGVSLDQILSENTDYKKAIVSTEIVGLDIIATTQDDVNSSELLDSKAMRDLMASTKSDYDFVILDTPSIKGNADALVVSSMADATIFVCELENANADDVLAAKEDLMKVKANIVGVFART